MGVKELGKAKTFSEASFLETLHNNLLLMSGSITEREFERERERERERNRRK